VGPEVEPTEVEAELQHDWLGKDTKRHVGMEEALARSLTGVVHSGYQN
jgi:hypothetical protein